MHDTTRDAMIWDAGFLIGYRYGATGRANPLAGKYSEPCEVIDMRLWRIEHDARAVSRQAGGATS